jgi:hypothetical protein
MAHIEESDRSRAQGYHPLTVDRSYSHSGCTLNVGLI